MLISVLRTYREDMMDAFEKDVFPYIGHRPIAEIKPLELLDFLSIMEKKGVTDKLKKVANAVVKFGHMQLLLAGQNLQI
ncbi:hypothetical protein TCT1_13420 [Xenorhabdus sp. TCT-1]|uniref:Phage integrase central domain-containing protein n=1 Tax=Xenorhabdus taiwanensis TaxID=3085177 RepID=A0ABM8JUQ8_9GAMM|nr:hypothetical protein TCT1_13420 [Xenorhabdus sp. TCT-1]